MRVLSPWSPLFAATFGEICGGHDGRMSGHFRHGPAELVMDSRRSYGTRPHPNKTSAALCQPTHFSAEPRNSHGTERNCTAEPWTAGYRQPPDRPRTGATYLSHVHPSRTARTPLTNRGDPGHRVLGW